MGLRAVSAIVRNPTRICLNLCWVTGLALTQPTNLLGDVVATIVAVHGTYATGPEEGEGWWQQGGALERDLRNLIEADDGRLDFVPHVWDGENSETSRRAAGEALLKRIAGLERDGRKYCLIGHSHGGSVVAAALLAAGGRKNALPGLSRWLTVGTPFIRGRRRGLLFSRLGLLGKSAYISFLVLAAYLAVAFSSAAMQDRSVPWWFSSIGVAVFALSAFLPFILLHALLWWRDRGRSRLFRVKDHRRAREAFHGRWLCFRHPADEAVEGLRAAPTVRFPIFSRRFLVAPLSAVTVILAPIAALLAVEAIPLPDISDQPLLKAGQELAQTVEKRLQEGAIPIWLVATSLLVLFFVVPPLVLFGLATALVLAMQALSARLSAVLSRQFDRLTWHQIRQSAFGNDTVGEIAVEATDRPVWMGVAPASMPEELSREVGALADAAAAQAVAKLRRAVQLLAFSEGEQKKSDLLAEYLTWDELIHTAYFKVPRFRKLVALAIAQSPGFRPSEKFKADPDYATLGRWCEQLSQPAPAR